MRVSLGGILVGVALYWAAQHFLGVGVTGRGKAG